MTDTINLKDLADTLNSAVALHRQGNKAAAREKYEKILFYQTSFERLAKKSGPDQSQQTTIVKNIFSQTYNNLGTFLEGDGLWGQALGYFRKALDYSPGNVEALTNLARVYAKRKNFDSALEAAKKALEINPKYIPAVIQFTRACYNFGHTGMALEALDQVKGELAANVRLNIEYGRILEKAGRLDEARKKLEKAVSLAPDNAYALLNLANVNFQLNRFEKALENYRRILEINPKHVEALAGMGFLLQTMGQFQDATKCYQMALAENQGHHETLGFYASLLDLSGRAGEALEMAERLLKMPKIPERALLTGALVKASSERKLGRLEDSIETLKAVKPYAKTSANRTQVLFGLGYGYDLMKKPGLAFKEFENANREFLGANRALIEPGQELPDLLDNLLAADFTPWFPKTTKKPRSKDPEAPVFVIGPTLGGNMAVAQLIHFAPKISVFEDIYIIQGIRRQLARLAEGYPACLGSLEGEQLSHTQGLYEEGLKKSVFKGEEGRPVHVDAMHIVDLPLILKLFPNAKVVFVHCDPRDSVLNTFFKDFIPTRTTINYADLETIAGLYAKTMDLWDKYQKELPLGIMSLKYADFIKDPVAGLEKILKFMEYGNLRAARKGFDNDGFNETAAELLNKYPPGRWKDYKIHLEKVLPALEPYCRAQGYPD